MNLNKDIDCFLLDLDGTVYFGSRPIDGAIEAIQRMRKSKKVFFLTNNSSATKDFYVHKLSSMGISVDDNGVYTSANAASDWLKENKPLARVYVVASPEVTDEFRRSGINVDDENPDTVLLTFDKTLDYKKLTKCCDLINKGAFYLATHPDMTCPIENGELPDIGSFMRLIQGATGRSPDLICGKPYSVIAKCILKITGVPSYRTAMIGDRLSTDMKFAIDNGFKSVLTLTGVTDIKSYNKSELKVDKIIDSISEWDL